MLERDSKIFNLMLALRSSRKGSRVQDPVVSIISDIFRRLAMPRAIREQDFESLMNLTIAKIADTINAQAITTFFVEGEAIRFKYIYYSPTLYDAGPDIRQKFETTKQELLKRGIQKGQGVVGKVIANNEVVVVEDTSKDSSFLKSVDKFTGFETKSMITVPLQDGNSQAVGAIQVLNKNIREGGVTHFTQEDVELLKEVADYSSKIFQKMINPAFQLSEEDTARYIAKVSGCEFLELKLEDISPEIRGSLQVEMLRKYNMIPVRKGAQGYIVASSDPMARLIQEKFEKETPYAIEEILVTPQHSIEGIFEELGKAG